MDFSDLNKMWLNFQLYHSVSYGYIIPPHVKYLTALIVIGTGNKLFSILQVVLINRLESHG